MKFLKSAEVYDYVRKDFDEFTQTVSEEVSTTASALKEKLKVLFTLLCCKFYLQFFLVLD